MNDVDLLSGVFDRIGKERAKRETDSVNLDDDITDIVFLMHWLPQLGMMDLLEMPLKRFNALLTNAKADYYTDSLQMMIAFSYANADAEDGEKYAKSLRDEIKRLRG